MASELVADFPLQVSLSWFLAHSLPSLRPLLFVNVGVAVATVMSVAGMKRLFVLVVDNTAVV